MQAMNDRYLKQVIVVRKDLTMPAGKMAAMAFDFFGFGETS